MWREAFKLSRYFNRPNLNTRIMENEIIFWKDGDYTAKGGIFIRNDLKTFFQTLIDQGLEPVGIKVDMDSFNLEVIVKAPDEDN